MQHYYKKNVTRKTHYLFHLMRHNTNEMVIESRRLSNLPRRRCHKYRAYICHLEGQWIIVGCDVGNKIVEKGHQVECYLGQSVLYSTQQ